MNEHLLIKVPEKEFERLLQREEVICDVQKYLNPWISLMRDVVNYGTNLIPRCFGSSSRTLADAVVIGILLRQGVAMLDGAEVLLSNGAVHSAKLQMRALLEVVLYIHWILVSDSEKKTDYYYVHNLRRKRLWAERVQGQSPAAQDFIAIMNSIGVPMRQEALKAAQEQLPEIDRVLAQPKFAHINAIFDSNRKGVPWYFPLGPRNLREIAKALGKLAKYVLVYSGGSEVMHGSNYEQHVTFSKGIVTFAPIRYLADFASVYHFKRNFRISSVQTGSRGIQTRRDPRIQPKIY